MALHKDDGASRSARIFFLFHLKWCSSYILELHPIVEFFCSTLNSAADRLHSDAPASCSTLNGAADWLLHPFTPAVLTERSGSSTGTVSSHSQPVVEVLEQGDMHRTCRAVGPNRWRDEHRNRPPALRTLAAAEH